MDFANAVKQDQAQHRAALASGRTKQMRVSEKLLPLIERGLEQENWRVSLILYRGGRTQEEAAKIAAVSVSTIQNWEAGRTLPTTATQQRVLTALYQSQ